MSELIDALQRRDVGAVFLRNAPECITGLHGVFFDGFALPYDNFLARKKRHEF